MKGRKYQFRPSVTREGQPYIDDEVVLKADRLKFAVAAAVGNKPPLALPTGEYEHVKLRWMKPDGKGGLTPKY